MFSFVVTESKESEYRKRGDKRLISDDDAYRCSLYQALSGTTISSFEEKEEAILCYNSAIERIAVRRSGFVSLQVFETKNCTAKSAKLDAKNEKAKTQYRALFIFRLCVLSLLMRTFFPVLLCVFGYLCSEMAQTKEKETRRSVVVSYFYSLQPSSPTIRLDDDILQFCVFKSKQTVDADVWYSNDVDCQKFDSAKEAMALYCKLEELYEKKELCLISLQVKSGPKMLRTQNYGTKFVTLYERRRMGDEYAHVTEEDWKNNSLSKLKWADDIARRRYLVRPGTDLCREFSPECARYIEQKTKSTNDDRDEVLFDLFD